MARITVEDCIDKFPSRFELVLVASNRARKLHSGESTTLDKDNDKNTVIALREIAEETLTIEVLKNDLIEEYQTTTFNEDEELDEPDGNSIENNENDEILSNVNELSSSNASDKEKIADEEVSADDEVSEDELSPDMENKEDAVNQVEENENLSEDDATIHQEETD
tara:strand:+ start:307 stop:804 length:498 start_codon:yes stop_codon:yes gene_type:complete